MVKFISNNKLSYDGSAWKRMPCNNIYLNKVELSKGYSNYMVKFKTSFFNSSNIFLHINIFCIHNKASLFSCALKKIIFIIYFYNKV